MYPLCLSLDITHKNMYNINFIYLFLDSIPMCYNEYTSLQDSNIIAYSHLRGILQISAMCLSLHTIIISFKSKVCLSLRVGLTDICCNFNHCRVKITNWSVCGPFVLSVIYLFINYDFSSIQYLSFISIIPIASTYEPITS